jgi:hypothetical protein
MKRFLSILLIASIATLSPASGQPLQGGVEQVEILPVLNLQLLQPKTDERGLSFKQNCTCFEPAHLASASNDGRLRLVEGDKWLLDFGSKSQEIEQAVKTIKHFGFTELCTLGKGSNGSPQMQYFLVNGAAPSGSGLTGEDAISFDLTKVKAEQIKGTWKITEGDHWMLDFGTDEEAAKHAEEVIHHYGFTNECFVGRPNAPMMYFRK